MSGFKERWRNVSSKLPRLEDIQRNVPVELITVFKRNSSDAGELSSEAAYLKTDLIKQGKFSVGTVYAEVHKRLMQNNDTIPEEFRNDLGELTIGITTIINSAHVRGLEDYAIKAEKIASKTGYKDYSGEIAKKFGEKMFDSGFITWHTFGTRKSEESKPQNPSQLWRLSDKIDPFLKKRR